MDTFDYLFLSFIALALFFPQATASGDRNKMEINHVNGIVIGAIVDNSSRVGKEAKVAMEMAIDDFNNHANQSLLLQIRNSQGDPVEAVLAARDLINTQQVQAIIGPHTWEESSLIAEVGSQAHVPILSLADSIPQWATMRWPFLIQASPSQHIQMKAVAAIVQSWGWRRVTVIYEDINSAANGVISHLSDALREIGTEINQLLPLPPFTSSSLMSQELEKLKSDQCRVFVVHTSLPLAIRLFSNAREMEMMENGYVWITTDSITSLFHSINASTISSMEGILGVKSYFQELGTHFQDFNRRFRRKFSTEHPEEEENHEPGIFALQAYDATRAVALALGGRVQQLLEQILLIDFSGLTGKFQFTERKLAPTHIFQIVNVIGRSYRELGFWSEELGFSKKIDQRVNNKSSSMENLGQVFWPGGPKYTPRGWTLPTRAKPMRIGVPTRSPFKQFVNVVYDPRANTTSYTGFSIKIFEATVERLPYYLPYEFFPFTGTYDDLVEQIYLKKFDAVAGDVAIVGRRHEHAEFTHPYTESGLVMIAPVQPEMSNKAWLFMKPFTKSMWVLIATVNIYNGFVVWLIERNHCPELKGSAFDQIGTLLWLAFTTLFSLQGERLHSNLSRMAMVVWLFVALVIIQSYTASLSSMLTVQRLEPTIADIETLKNGNAMVGYCRGSYVARYLMDVLHFKSNNIKNFTAAGEYARALKTGEIAVGFFDVPFAKLFLAKYCKSFTIAGPTYKVGGFGFVFPKGSPLLPDINIALVNVSESGVLRELENSMTGSEKCVDVDSAYGNGSLDPSSFWVLFIFTGGTTTAALAIYVILGMWKSGNFMLEHRNIWKLILAVMKHWRHQKRRFSRRVSDSGDSRNPSNSWTQV